MNNYNKFQKYFNKYQLFIGGNKIDTMKDLFNAYFDNSWILSGSEAIKKYLHHFKIPDFDFPTNDVDIIYVSSNQLSSRTIGEYTRKQAQVENSMTFIKDDSSFDINIVKGPVIYYEIDGLKLHSPNIMLENYEENIEFRNNPYDKIKIAALREIIKVINPEHKLRLEIDNKKRRLEDLEQGRRLRLTYIDVNAPVDAHVNAHVDAPDAHVLRKALKLSDLE